MPDSVFEMKLGPVNIRVESLGMGVEGAKPDEMAYTATVEIEWDRLEFSFISPPLSDTKLIVFVLGWLFDATDLSEEEFIKGVLGPEPDPDLKEQIEENAKETIVFAKRWRDELLIAAKRMGPEIRDSLAGGRPSYMGSPMKLEGNRFDGFISANKKLSDINDKKQDGKLTLLSQNDIQKLRDEVDRIVIKNAEKESWKPFDIKLKEKSSRHVISQINEEDARELLELLDSLDENMVPL